MFDCVIIGAGPAGLTAAIYLLRAGKKIVVLEKEQIGGQMSSSPWIENYPGYNGISGVELSNNLYEQVINLGGEVLLEEVMNVTYDGDIKNIVTDMNEYKAKSVIIATGSKFRMLGLENEENLIGRGISFCVSCDGAFFKNKEVAVIGGGNSALINAISLSSICSKVYIFQLLENFTAEKALVDKVNSISNIEKYFNTSVVKINGDRKLESIDVNVNGEIKNINISGMFISIGLLPQNDIFKNIIELEDNGYFKVKEDRDTNVDGIFVCGDCLNKKVKQITTAVADGTIASVSAIRYLDK